MVTTYKNNHCSWLNFLFFYQKCIKICFQAEYLQGSYILQETIKFKAYGCEN